MSVFVKRSCVLAALNAAPLSPPLLKTLDAFRAGKPSRSHPSVAIVVSYDPSTYSLLLLVHSLLAPAPVPTSSLVVLLLFYLSSSSSSFFLLSSSLLILLVPLSLRWVSFLTSAIGPRVAAACASAALSVLTREDSRGHCFCCQLFIFHFFYMFEGSDLRVCIPKLASVGHMETWVLTKVYCCYSSGLDFIIVEVVP
ncbi:hypothetical protein B296_00008486 [Ensete ventricosum]|uniref:Uncharacterized protein n=1 Tax=Ensete ventricosum TaxID=4639 RepID=A0A427BB24_ENSVE|nr:hypothetical protein B296_00008486 [Ensete ventricosum]